MSDDAKLGDAPVSPEYIETMKAAARTIDRWFNGELTGKDRKVGFVMMVFPFNQVDGSRVNYISNGANRREIVILMKEMIARFEGQPEIKGRA
jgi:hypothetical protein